MNGLSPSEKATLNFYEWEYRGRGYYHFDTPVDIEPPYTPFRFQNYADTIIDDGKVPSLFSRALKFLNPSQTKNEVTKNVEIGPKPLSVQDTLKGFSFSFPKGQEISALITQELLAMLSLCNHFVSFEIVSHSKQIQFQFVFSEQDELVIKSNLFAYFPLAKIIEINPFDIPFSFEKNVAIADFGLRDECMRPIQNPSNYTIDPLAPIISLCNFLEKNETALVQIIFQGVRSPWAKDMRIAVSDGSGGSFFFDSPEMPKLTEQKTHSLLVSCVFRMAIQGQNDMRSEQLATQYIKSISKTSESPYNTLIPLSNEEYDYEHHLKNIYYRQSNRLGMLLNIQELSLFVHYPNKTVVSDLLGEDFERTKLAPQSCFNQKYLFGYNTHEKEQYKVGIDDETFSKHLLIAGATGTGKTHFLKQLISTDIEHQNSSFVIDPHGDLTLDMLSLVDENQKDQIVYINIADDSVAFGFNIFEA